LAERTNTLWGVFGKIERPNWQVNRPDGATLRVEFDPFRRTWRVDPGGYTRRELPDALAQATGSSRNAAWIVELDERLRAELRAADGLAS
jgi:hypothetical protein